MAGQYTDCESTYKLIMTYSLHFDNYKVAILQNFTT